MSPYTLLALSVTAVLAAGTYLQQRLQYRKKQRALRAKLRAEWGRPKSIARDLPLLASYHQAVSADGGGAVDDRTWRDLDLDAVFGFLDRTESIVGRQILYHRLRSTTYSPAGLSGFDDLVEVWRRDEATRLDVQVTLGSLAENSTYWLWSLVLEPIEPLARWAVIYPLFALAMALLILLTAAFHGPFLVLAVLGLVAGGALRARFGRRLVPLVEPFRDMARLLGVAERLGRMEYLPTGVRQRLTGPLPALARLRRSAGWLGRAQTGTADLSGLAIEYLNLVFCLDANAAMIGVRELRRHQDEMHETFRAVGELDAALSVASVRSGGEAWTRPVFVPDDEPAALADLRHPLLDNAVPNSVTLGSPAGMLVTGANMTGKSTFLRTVGVNVVLAQTIDTAFASTYRAPWLSVASCIGAASAVLACLVSGPARCLVIAATHDLEIVSLLASDYAVVHFADELRDGGLYFDYLLRPGPTTTRNAIALLGVLGAPPEVVAEALARTERLRGDQRKPL